MAVNEQVPVVVERYWGAVARRAGVAINDLVTEDFVEDWPQSGERIRGAGAWRRVVDGHPTYPSVSVRRFVGEASVWVCEADFDYGDGNPWRVCSVMELRGDRIARISQYFGAPFPAADWRDGITEQI